MKLLVILSAFLGATLAYPHVGYIAHRAHQAPQIPSAYAVVAPSIPIASTNIYAPAAPPVVNVPVITGTLHHSQDTLGQYEYGYSSSDGQAKEEKKDSDGQVSGHFNFISPEGQNIKLSYNAGSEGFQAEGDHLPESVELPEELKQAYQEANERLEKAHAEARLRGETEEDDGQYSEEKYGEKSSVQTPQLIYAQVQTPTYQVAVPAKQHVQYAVAAPAKPSVHYAAAIPNIHYAPAPPQVHYAVAAAPAPVPSHAGYGAAPAQKEEEEKEEEKEVSAPAPYLKSSYQTEIGGPVAQVAPVAQVPVVSAPVKSHYGHSHPSYY